MHSNCVGILLLFRRAAAQHGLFDEWAPAIVLAAAPLSLIRTGQVARIGTAARLRVRMLWLGTGAVASVKTPMSGVPVFSDNSR